MAVGRVATAPGTKALVPQVKPRVERGGAGPRGNAALRLVQLENAELRLLPTDVTRAESKRDQARAVSAVHVAIAREAKRAAKEERSRAETAATMAAPAEGRAWAGAEAVARVTAECIVAGCRREWGSTRALGRGSAGRGAR